MALATRWQEHLRILDLVGEVQAPRKRIEADIGGQLFGRMFPTVFLVQPPAQASDPPTDRPGALEAELEFLRAFEAISRTSVEPGYQADVLKWAAASRYRQRRNLNFSAGLIALLSAAAVAAVVTSPLQLSS